MKVKILKLNVQGLFPAPDTEVVVEQFSPEYFRFINNARHVIADGRRAKWKAGPPEEPVDLIVTTLPETN
jgi:hypothetical protein